VIAIGIASIGLFIVGVLVMFWDWIRDWRDW
jgi:hypothetical protein